MSFPANQIGRAPSYGFIWMNSGGWTTVTFNYTTSYQELTGLSTPFVLASPSQDFAMTTDGRLKYTGSVKKRFLVDASCNTNTGFLKIYKNGVAINDSESYGAASPRIAGYWVDLTTNDYISLWFKSTSTTAGTITQISLSATSTDRAL